MKLHAPSTQPTDTPQSYAFTLALWSLANIPDHGAIATAALTLEQLDIAAWGLNHALTQRVMLAELSTPPVVYDRIAQVLAFIRQRQFARQAAQAALIEAAAQAAQPAHPPDSHPAGGKPVFPPTPAPRPLGPQHQESPTVQKQKAEVYF